MILLTWNFVDGSKRSENSEGPNDGQIVIVGYYFLNQAERRKHIEDAMLA